MENSILADIITLMILARLCGHTVKADIMAFGSFNLGRFRNLGMLENGVPSEPMFCRVEKGIDETHAKLIATYRHVSSQ